MNRVRWVTAAFICFGVAVYAVPINYWGYSTPAPEPKAGPRLVCPALISLGEQERGTHISAPVRICNQGDEELVLDQFGSSCSCAGLWLLKDGEYRHVESLRVPAGGAVELSARLTVQGADGTSQSTATWFHTNDPGRETVRVDLVVDRVKAGVSFEPPTVFVGEVKPGDPVTVTVSVIDYSRPPRKVQKVTTSGERVQVRVSSDEPAAGAGYRGDGTRIARLDIRVDISQPGRIEELVTVSLPGRSDSPDPLRVIGRVLPAVVVTPSRLVLPLSSQSGLIYSGKYLMRSTVGGPLKLAPSDLPDDVTATLSDVPGSEASQVVTVTWDASGKHPSRTAATRVLRFAGTAAGQPVSVSADLICSQGSADASKKLAAPAGWNAR